MSFSWTRVRAIVIKELRDYRRNRFVVGTMTVLPLLFVALPLIQVFNASAHADSSSPHVIRSAASADSSTQARSASDASTHSFSSPATHSVRAVSSRTAVKPADSTLSVSLTGETTSAYGARVRLEWGEHTDISEDLRACATEHDCDLIVVGRHGEDSRLRIAGLGPVARALAQNVDLPVLLVSALPGR